MLVLETGVTLTLWWRFHLQPNHQQQIQMYQAQWQRWADLQIAESSLAQIFVPKLIMPLSQFDTFAPERAIWPKVAVLIFPATLIPTAPVLTLAPELNVQGFLLVWVKADPTVVEVPYWVADTPHFLQCVQRRHELREWPPTQKIKSTHEFRTAISTSQKPDLCFKHRHKWSKLLTLWCREGSKFLHQQQW